MPHTALTTAPRRGLPCLIHAERAAAAAAGSRAARAVRTARAARAQGQRPLRGILSPSGANDASRRAAQSLGWTSGAQSAAASAPSAVSAASFVDAAPPLQGRTRARTISTAARRLQRRGAALTTARRGGGRCFVFRGRLVCECVPYPTDCACPVDANTANPIPHAAGRSHGAGCGCGCGNPTEATIHCHGQHGRSPHGRCICRTKECKQGGGAESRARRLWQTQRRRARSRCRCGQAILAPMWARQTAAG